MKKFAIVLVFALVVGGFAVAAEKPYQAPIDFSQMKRVPCALQNVVIDWDFSVSDQGFATTTCDPTMPDPTVPVWEYGTTTYVAGAPGDVWATVLEGNYPADIGEGLISPPFMVDPTTNLMEVMHYYDFETNYDGCNVNVFDSMGGLNLITPTDGYDFPINPSASYYAWCVDGEDGFTGHAATWEQVCFDLSAFDGQTIQVQFDMGNDISITYPGWYLAYVQIGNVIPVELQSFDID